MPIKTDSKFTTPSLQELINRITGDYLAAIEENKSTLSRPALTALKLLSPVMARIDAGVAYTQHKLIAYAMKNFFPQFAAKPYLKLWGRIASVPIKSATYAKRTATATGSTGSTIPAEKTLIHESTGVEFEAVGTATVGVDETATINVKAKEPGTDGNIATGETLVFTSPISGVDTETTVASETTDAIDEESRAAWSARIIQALSEPAAGGNELDFIDWALDAANVANVWAIDNDPYPGFITLLYTLTGEAPIPNGGGAYRVVVTARNQTEGWIEVERADFDTKLGVTSSVEWFQEGRVIFDPKRSPSKEYSTITADGLQLSGGAWRIEMTDPPDPLPLVGHSVDILCAYTAAVWDAVHTEDPITGNKNQAPFGVRTDIRLPLALEIDLEIAIPEYEAGDDAETLRAAIESEIEEALSAYTGPSTTLTAWRIRQAISLAAGHTQHKLIDVSTDDDGSLGAEGAVTTGSRQIHTKGDITWTAWSAT